MMDTTAYVLQWFLKFLIKKSFGGVATRQRPVTLDKSTVKSENMPKQQLAEESCKSIILVKFGKL